MKMALNNSISLDRDALREQQRQARALMMDTKDSPINPADLFNGPIRLARPSDDPLRKKIQKTLGEYDNFKETISSNPKNLIGITSQPPTPLPTSAAQPHFADALKPAKPPYANGFKGPNHHHQPPPPHHSRGAPRSSNPPRSNGWAKGPPPPSQGHKGEGPLDKPKPPFHPHHPQHHPPPALTHTSGAKSSAGSEPSLPNGHLFNGVPKAPINRPSVPPKPNLRLNIDDAQTTKVANQEQAELENILKEMIAPTPLTAIPTPRKEDTKFPFSATVAATVPPPQPPPQPPHTVPPSTNSPPHSVVPERPSLKSVTRSLEKPLAASHAPSAAEKPGAFGHGIAEILGTDLDISESDDDEGTSGRKACASSRSAVSVRPAQPGAQSQAPPPSALLNSDSDNSSSSSESSSEPEVDTSDNEEEESGGRAAKPISPPNISGMNWGLDNFMVTSPTVPFGLPADSTPCQSSDSRSSTATRREASGAGRKEDEAPAALLTAFPRSHEAFARIIDKDVPVVSPPLSPSSPPHALPPKPSAPNTTSHRPRDPKGAPTPKDPAAKKALLFSNNDKYGYTSTPTETKPKPKPKQKSTGKASREKTEAPKPAPSSAPAKAPKGQPAVKRKEEVKAKHKSPSGRKPKSATKYPSKAIISDDDSDIDVGGASPLPAATAKSPAAGSKAHPHFSSSSTLASSAEDVSTATPTVLTAKAPSRHSASSSKKRHKPSTPPPLPPPMPKGGSREALKSKTKPNKTAAGSGCGPDEWLHVPAPLSPISKDDAKEEEAPKVKLPPLTYKDGFPSLMVKLDLSLLDRVPAFPPQQLRLLPSAPSEEEQRKKKPKRPVEEPKAKQTESGKENRTDGNSLKGGKRPLGGEPEARKAELKKVKSSSSSAKDKSSSVESLNQFPHKTKATAADTVKLKKDVEEKGSPAARPTQSPADRASSAAAAEKKAAKKPSAHKPSSDAKRDKKHPSSSSTLPNVKKEKSSRESEVLSVKVEDVNSFSGTKAGSEFALSASSSSSLTTQNLSKEAKLRARGEHLEVPDSKRRKWSGSNSSITSQTNSVSGNFTDSQKAIKSEGIERKTNHDRIVPNPELGSSKSSSVSSSSSSAPSCNNSKDLDSVLNFINEIVDLSSHSIDFYLTYAKKLKHDADNEADRTTKALKYLHSGVYFGLCGVRMEIDPNHTHGGIYAMYSNTTNLFKFVSSKFRSHQSTNVNSSVENKGAVLTLWCQSTLNFKLYTLKRNEVKDCNNTLSEYQKTPANPGVPNRPGSRQMTSPGQSSSSNQAVPPTMWSKSNGAPSPMSPLPSPANSVGSVESQSSGYSSSELPPRSGSAGGSSTSHNSSSVLQQQTVSIPVHLHSIMQKQLVNLGHLHSAHELWEQADSLIVRGGNQDFFTFLDEQCGKKNVNPMLSSMHDLSRHVLLGLHLLGQTIVPERAGEVLNRK